jgi:hypothetical protein
MPRTSNFSTSSIVEVPLSGGNPTTLAASAPFTGSSLAATGGAVYWIGPPGILSVPSTGGSIGLVVALAQGQALAASDTTLGWGTADGFVGTAPRAGGPATTLASGQFQTTAVTLDANNVYWAQTGCPDSGSGPCGAVVAESLAGGASITLATGATGSSLIVAGGDLYWMAASGVASCPISGCQSSPLTIGDSAGATAFTTDGERIVWGTYPGDIVEYALSSGAVTTLASGQGPTVAMAVDGTSVYWASDSGTIMKVTPK